MDPKDLFRGQSQNLECPSCKNEFPVSAEDLFTEGTVISCPHCNAQIRLDNSEAIRDMKQVLNDLLKPLSKTIRINIKL